MSKRFDLEQEIMHCWAVTDDIKLLYERIMDGPALSQDEMANILLGMSQLYQLKFEKLFDTFEQCISNKEI